MNHRQVFKYNLYPHKAIQSSQTVYLTRRLDFTCMYSRMLNTPDELFITNWKKQKNVFFLIIGLNGLKKYKEMWGSMC